MEKNKLDMKLLKYVLLILLLIVLVFLGITLRKFFIINKYVKTIEEYSSYNNYYIKKYSYGGSFNETEETFYKNGKTLTKISTSNNKEITFYYDSTTKEYITLANVDGSKVAYIEKSDNINKINTLKVSNLLDEKTDIKNNFLLAIKSKNISIEKCNNKQCYVINNSGIRLWIDKETFMNMRDINKLSSSNSSNNKENFNIVSDYIYSFNTVTDKDIAKPDLSGYKIEYR